MYICTPYLIIDNEMMTALCMVWVKLGRLVYGASDRDLCEILGEQGNDCAELVFERSHWRPEVTAGVMREESICVLRDYFSGHQKG